MDEQNHETTIETTPRAMFAGQVDFGTGPVDCYTTGDGLSLLTTRGITQVLTGTGSGNLGRMIARIQPETAAVSLQPTTRFRMPHRPAVAQGHPAKVLVQICRLYTAADRAGNLHPSQVHILDRARLVLDGLAERGLDAMIWEATGYEKYKEANAHQRSLLLWLREEAGAWSKLFPDEFYLELGKLFRLHLPVPGRRPSVFAAFTSEFVYHWFDDNVCPGAYAALTERNPDPTMGTRHHQFLTGDGRKAIASHIAVVTALMRASATPNDFRMRFNAVFRGGMLQLALAN